MKMDHFTKGFKRAFKDAVKRYQDFHHMNEERRRKLSIDRSKHDYHLSHADEEEENFDEEESDFDDDETHKDVLDKSILAIKECLDPEPILDRFQASADIPYTDVRDIGFKDAAKRYQDFHHMNEERRRKPSIDRNHDYHLSHADEEEENFDEEESDFDDDETHKDVLDKSILAIKECLDPEPILDRFQASADIPYTDVRDIGFKDAVKRYQDFHHMDEEKRRKPSIDRSKHDYHLSHADEEEEDFDEEEPDFDDDETHKDVLDKSILAIKECLDPEPILDRFQASADIPYTDVRDIRDEEGAETRQKYLFHNVCDEETTADKIEISDSLNKKGDEITEYFSLEESASKAEEAADTMQKYLFQNVFDEETTSDKEEISDSLNKKGDEITEYFTLEESASKVEEAADTMQKYLFKNVFDEETTSDKEEISDSLNKKGDEITEYFTLEESASKVEEAVDTMQKYLFKNVFDEETTSDKEEISDSVNEKGDEITEYFTLEESASKVEEAADTMQKYLFQNEFDEETTSDKEKISDSLNKKGDEMTEYFTLEQSASKEDEDAVTRQKYLFQNECDEETTVNKEEISDSLNEKEDDEEETAKDTEEIHKRVLDRSISTIKECMNPEPILDSLLEDNIFQNIDIRDIMEKSNTTKKNETIIEKVRQNGKDVYKRFKKYLWKSHQYLLLTFIEKTENGEETTDIQKKLKEDTRRRLKEIRNHKLCEETSVNLLEEQLVISMQRGNEFEGTEDIEESLGIHTSSVPISRKCCNVVKCIFEGTVEKYSDQLIKAVKDVASIMNVRVRAASLDKDNTVVLTMACASCEEIRMLLKILKGNEFKSKIENLKSVLSKEYEIVCVIHAKVSHEKIKEVQQHLMDQGVINETHADDLFCDIHYQQQAELFCPGHDKFFCQKCEVEHRMCQGGVRKITKDGSTKMYRIRSNEPANKLCTTLRLCTLPSSEILLIDNVNKKLKKLDLSYSVRGQYTFNKSETPLDVCAIHASKAFVTFGDQVCVVNVGDVDIHVEKVFKTKAPCLRLYRNGRAIYYTDNLSIYTCDENGENHKKLYQFGNETFCHGLVVNDDRSKIVVAAGDFGLIIIDANSQNQSTVALKELQGCTDLCIVDSQNLLVCASNALYLVNIKHGKVLKQAAIGLRCPRSFAFDVIDNSVIGGNLGNDFISVFNVNIEYDAT